MTDDRYQNQRWWVRAYRRAWATPKWWLKFQWYRVRYYLGYVEDDRPLSPKIVRSLFRGLRDCDIKHYYTVDEVLHDLRT